MRREKAFLVELSNGTEVVINAGNEYQLLHYLSDRKLPWDAFIEIFRTEKAEEFKKFVAERDSRG